MSNQNFTKYDIETSQNPAKQGFFRFTQFVPVFIHTIQTIRLKSIAALSYTHHA